LSALLIAPLILAGCATNLVPVSGKVTIDNKPLTTGTVTLKPDKEHGNKNTVEPLGTIGADGAYTIETNGLPGAPPGAYKVVVVAQGPPKNPKDPYSPAPLIVNTKYVSETTTDLTITVPSDSYDLKLSR
jgi:hypothetical protein